VVPEVPESITSVVPSGSQKDWAPKEVLLESSIFGSVMVAAVVPQFGVPLVELAKVNLITPEEAKVFPWRTALCFASCSLQ